MNHLHPSRRRDDEHLFDQGYQPYNPLVALWRAYVPRWVDWVVLAVLGLAVIAEIIWGVFGE